MTENEVIRYGKDYLKDLCCAACKISDIHKNFVKMAIKALEEIQQYRAIGTVEECRDAREKQKPKRIIIKNTKNKKLEKGIYVFYKCPECEEQIASGFYYPPHNEFLQEHRFCKNCGQAISWGSDATWPTK